MARHSMRLLACLLLALYWLPLWAEPGLRPVDDPAWTTEYDRFFRKYTKRYFGPAFDWRWFKAQAIAESNLKPRISSHAGAIGLMQILPATYEEIRARNPHFKQIRDPEWNIAAGIFYDRLLYRKWREPLPDRDRLLLAFASYNAGYVRIRRIFRRLEQQLAHTPLWDEMEPAVPGETRHYVRKIVTLVEGRPRKPVRRLRGVEKFLVFNQQG
ncbi:MAG: lytic transglycosylase domain-containing protein [Gammaproteobacteria bacterium]|nr:MAG: lytic transglycosylase domain-containing protein [Gammaproteobacteria bacterium]